jgi:hypothetical protein
MKRFNAKKRGQATDEELAISEQFMQLELDGKDPSVDEFMSKYPNSRRVLRQLVMGAKLLCTEYRRFQRANPGVNVWRLADQYARH